MNVAPFRTYLSSVGYFLCLGFCFVTSGLAVRGQESKPLPGTRDGLVSALNSFLSEHNNLATGQGMETRSFPSQCTGCTFTANGGAGAEDNLYLYDPIFSTASGGCEDVGAGTFNIDFTFYPGYFTMKRSMHPAGTATPDALRHELVVDLNSWLNSMWGLELKGIPEFDALGWQCINGGTPSDNRFYTAETQDAEAIEVIQDLTGESLMLDKWYNINGTYRKGSDILSFEKTGITRTVRYMTDRGGDTDPALQDTIRYLANAYLEIDLDADNTPEFTLEIQMQTTPYSTDNCGLSQFDDAYLTPDRTHSDYYNYGVDIRIVQTDLGIDFNQDNMNICEFGWYYSQPGMPAEIGLGEQFDGPTDENGYFRIPDSASKRMFRYIREHRGEWRYSELGQQYGSAGNYDDDVALYGVLQLGSFYLTAGGDLEFVRYKSGCCEFRKRSIGTLMSDFSAPEEFCEVTYCRGGQFFLDDTYRMLYYASPTTGCSACGIPSVTPPGPNPENFVSIPVACLPFCDSAFALPEVASQVVSTNARTFTDRTSLIDESEYLEFPKLLPAPWVDANQFERGIRGKWRPSREFVYRTATSPGTNLFPGAIGTERNYNDAGVFDMDLFNWQQIEPNLSPLSSWINPSVVSMYSQNGEPVEEMNILGIPSTAHFGYGQQVPILVATNASYNSTAFESFEGSKGNEWREAHSGKNSFHVSYDEINSFSPVLIRFEVDEYAISDDDDIPCEERDCGGLLIRFWGKPFYDPQDPGTSQTSGQTRCPVTFQFESNGMQEDLILGENMTLVAKTGDWGLFEGRCEGLTSADLGKIIEVKAMSVYPVIENDVYHRVWIDDLRMQPMKSEMVCYVYDADNLRQVAQFDDQHFGLFYQYNGEGKLLRRLRETERGIKTVQEAQYNTPFVTRDEGSSTITYPTSTAEWTGSGTPQTAQGKGGAAIPLFSAEIGLDDQRFSLLEGDPEEVEEKLSRWKTLLDLPALQELDLPEVEKLRLLSELRDVSDQSDSLAGIDPSSLDDERERQAREASLTALRERRAALLSRLDVSDAEAAAILDKAQRLRDESDAMRTIDNNIEEE